jgi:polyisoprenoid-binding protein YceI
MKAFKNIIPILALTLALTGVAAAQHNPCNPCGGKAMKAAHAAGEHSAMVFKIDDPMGRNSVTFLSTAPLEDVVGVSSQLSGMLVFDPFRPDVGGHGEIIVPVSSLNTGIPLRDEHLAGADWLNAEKNPNIVFMITKVRGVKEIKSTSTARTYDVVAVGDFSLNGRTREMAVPARITYLKESEATKQRQPGNLLAVRATFNIVLADFGITGPAGMDLVGSKVGDKIELSLSLVASSTFGAVAGNPCGGKAGGVAAVGNPCGPKAAKK